MKWHKPIRHMLTPMSLAVFLIVILIGILLCLMALKLDIQPESSDGLGFLGAILILGGLCGIQLCTDPPNWYDM